jgi:hypothetical protein
LFDHLNALVHTGDLRNLVRLVLTGAERLLEIKQKGSPLLLRITRRDLDALPDAAARVLVALAKGLPHDVAEAVIAQAGGHPFILQYLLYSLWETGAESATQERLTAAVGKFCSDRGADLDYWWSSIGPEGRQLYCILKRFDDWTPRSEIIGALGPDADAAVKRLTYYGLIAHDGTYLRYRTCGRLLRDWYGERCLVVDPPFLTQPSRRVEAGIPIQSGEYERLLKALLGGYNSSGLRQMLLLRLHVQLEQIVEKGSGEEVTLNVILWAARNGRLDELVLEASDYNRGNKDLQQFVQDHGLAYVPA